MGRISSALYVSASCTAFRFRTSLRIPSGSREAACVKWCDLQDNSDPARLKALPAETAQRLEVKYAPLKALFQEKSPWLFA